MGASAALQAPVGSTHGRVPVKSLRCRHDCAPCAIAGRFLVIVALPPFVKAVVPPECGGPQMVGCQGPRCCVCKIGVISGPIGGWPRVVPPWGPPMKGPGGPSIVVPIVGGTRVLEPLRVRSPCDGLTGKLPSNTG